MAGFDIGRFSGAGAGLAGRSSRPPNPGTEHQPETAYLWGGASALVSLALATPCCASTVEAAASFSGIV